MKRATGVKYIEERVKEWPCTLHSAHCTVFVNRPNISRPTMCQIANSIA